MFSELIHDPDFYLNFGFFCAFALFCCVAVAVQQPSGGKREQVRRGRVPGGLFGHLCV
jgi:hypothetical protein